MGPNSDILNHNTTRKMLLKIDIIFRDTRAVNIYHSLSEWGFEVLKTYQAPAHIWDLPSKPRRCDLYLGFALPKFHLFTPNLHVSKSAWGTSAKSDHWTHGDWTSMIIEL